MKKYSLIFLLVIGCSISAIASHIMGAELIYDYLGNNQFQITLKLYRNCSPSCTFCAPYGDPEYVQIFDSAGNYIDSIPMPLPTVNAVPANVTNPCLTPVDVCITEAFYTGTYTLAPRPGGYTLVYERCCRNSAIQTIPTQSGSTYIAHISNDIYATNSSPRFTNRPPLFICSGYYFQFDNSATDPDGDSLSYSLVNALDYTNSSNCLNPSPASGVSGCPMSAYPPPFPPVAYLPPYSATNPMDNPSSSIGNTTIDATTGLLTGIPNQTGFFVVAVAVSEFRNGQYIGQTIRDYQFNIVSCDIPAASLPYLSGTYNHARGFGSYSQSTTSNKVDFSGTLFTNPAPTSIPLVYHWDFGVTNSTNDTSNLEFPIYTYTDTGTYTVTVTTNKLGANNICMATAKANVEILTIVNALNEISPSMFVATVLPNPATATCTITVSNNTSTTYTASLIDITGKEVNNIGTFKERVNFDVSLYTKGLYLLRIANSQGQVVIKKVAVQ